MGTEVFFGEENGGDPGRYCALCCCRAAVGFVGERER